MNLNDAFHAEGEQEEAHEAHEEDLEVVVANRTAKNAQTLLLLRFPPPQLVLHFGPAPVSGPLGGATQ